jgi:hypothetical protein
MAEIRDKAEAETAYRRLLAGRWMSAEQIELPSDLLNQATAEDFAAAEGQLREIAAAQWMPGTYSGGSEYEMRQQWERRPDLRAQQFGVPWLKMAIEKRRETEEREARRVAMAQRIEAGFYLDLPLRDALVKRLPAAVDRTDPQRIGTAAMALLGLPTGSLVTARSEPPDIVLTLHLEAEQVRALLPNWAEHDEEGARRRLIEVLTEAFSRAVAPRQDPAEARLRAMWPFGIPSNVLAAMHGQHEHRSPSRDRYDDPGADYLTRGGWWWTAPLRHRARRRQQRRRRLHLRPRQRLRAGCISPQRRAKGRLQRVLRLRAPRQRHRLRSATRHSTCPRV